MREKLELHDVSDKLRHIIIKLEYLTNSHYSFLTLVNEAFVITERDSMGFSDVFDDLVNEFKAFENDLEPLIVQARKQA